MDALVLSQLLLCCPVFFYKSPEFLWKSEVKYMQGVMLTPSLCAYSVALAQTWPLHWACVHVYFGGNIH